MAPLLPITNPAILNALAHYVIPCLLITYVVSLRVLISNMESKMAVAASQPDHYAGSGDPTL